MNPFIKKQFILEAWQYNQSLENPFIVSYFEPLEYYHKNNLFKFSKNSQEKGILGSDKEKYYKNIVEKSIDAKIANSNLRDITIIGENDFLYPYFNYFFNKHPELQLDLLKFFNKFLNFSFKPTDFLKTFEKKQIEPFLTNINYWLSYSDENLKSLHELMISSEFSEGFRVSILKKYVNHNLKILNKTPYLSKGLEDFLFNHYPSSVDLITPNVVAIQNRFSPLDEDKYFSSFSKNKVICLYENIKIDSLLKTFQIAGWTNNSYISLIQSYHNYLTEKYDFKIKADFHQNQKTVEVYVSMNDNEYNLDKYHKDLLVLFKFYRNQPETTVNKENFEQIFLNDKLNESLIPNNKKTKANKI